MVDPVRPEPVWAMDERAKAARDEVAPAQRVFLKQLMDTLAAEGVNPNDVISFATEVLAAQVNLIVDRANERRTELERPHVPPDAILNIVVSDIFVRAELRRARGDD